MNSGFLTYTDWLRLWEDADSLFLTSTTKFITYHLPPPSPSSTSSAFLHPLFLLEPMVDNHHSGSGPQNNYNATYQNIIYGGHHLGTGGVVNISGDSLENTYAQARKLLWESISDVGASHTAEQQYERGSCLEGTRVELLRLIHEWIQAREKEKPLFWLTGAAGVGKSAIAMTVAEACEEEDILVSSFFFFRSDPKRNNPKAFVLTLAHDMLLAIPTTRRLVEERISKKTRILGAKLEDQFRELIFNPILQCSSIEPLSSPPAPNIIIIDGLDECSDERTQLRILNIIRDAAQHAPRFPLRFLICSRQEAWIKEAFAVSPLYHLSKVILLDDDFRTAKDIEKYCRHRFQEIISDSKYNQVRFPKPWPSETQLESLVCKSCNQFVYVTTVFRFITLAGNHPVNKLGLVLRDHSKDRTQPGPSPFSELDALYHTILEASPSPEDVHAVLVVILVLTVGFNASTDRMKPSPAHIELLLGLSVGQVALTLRRMPSRSNAGLSHD
ncbi:hypothetical protein PM082_023190 [Marasmius tenuissimus]|nr:hypothetical protein PM082_023190 [Marasmius tenuissimus]